MMVRLRRARLLPSKHSKRLQGKQTEESKQNWATCHRRSTISSAAHEGRQNSCRRGSHPGRPWKSGHFLIGLPFQGRLGRRRDAVFSQRLNFRLISDRHIQQGPAFPHPTDLLIDASTGQVAVPIECDRDKDILRGSYRRSRGWSSFQLLRQARKYS